MTRRTVGIVVAMVAEARALTGRSVPVRRPVPVGDDVVLWIGGAGGEAARQGCQALVDAGAVALASIGTAAGLAPDCTPGTLVLPHRVVRPGHAPISLDGGWRRALHAIIGKDFAVTEGDVAGTDEVLEPPAKQALYRQTGAASADMESAAVATFSARLQVPLMVVRAVSDGSADAVPAGVLSAVDAFGRPDYGRLLGSLARRPAEISEMLRLAAGFRAACRTLRRLARCAGIRFHCPG